ncbi:19916_t:CDS:2, partial [Dentiscutata erythropus]
MTQRKFWAALYILDERVIDGSSYYLIQWEGSDKGGNPWIPTWEPGENCTQTLINDWNKRRLETKKEDRYHRENSSVSDSTVTNGSELRCSDALALGDELPFKCSNSSNESLIMNQDVFVNPNGVSHDPQQLLKRTQTELQSQNLVGEKGIIYHASKKNRTQESLIGEESRISSDENNNFSCQRSFAQPVDTFKIQPCSSQTLISSQDISTQTVSLMYQNNTDFSDKKMHPNLSSQHQTPVSLEESLQNGSPLANNGTKCASPTSPGLNSNLSNKDPLPLVKELQNKADTIAILCEERDHFQKTLAQIKRNWQIQQEKAINLSKENEKIKQQLQQQTREYEKIRFQSLCYQQSIQQLQELCQCNSEKDVQHRLELEESRRKYEII